MSYGHSTPSKPGRKARFSALPYELQDDPRLKPRDLTTIANMLRYGISKSWVSMCNRTLAKLGRCGVRTIQLSLSRLEKAGWIRRAESDCDAAGATGRLVYFVWREGAMDDVPRVSAVAPLPMNQVAPELEGKGNKERAGNGPERAAVSGGREDGSAKSCVNVQVAPVMSDADREAEKAEAAEKYLALPVGHPMKGWWGRVAGITPDVFAVAPAPVRGKPGLRTITTVGAGVMPRRLGDSLGHVFPQRPR